MVQVKTPVTNRVLLLIIEILVLLIEVVCESLLDPDSRFTKLRSLERKVQREVHTLKHSVQDQDLQQRRYRCSKVCLACSRSPL